MSFDVDKAFARIEELLAQGWTTRAFARAADGTPRFSDDPEACSWCLSGAVNKAVGEQTGLMSYRDQRRFDAHDQVRLPLDKALTAFGVLPGVPMIHWNDDPARTRAQVLGVVQAARALAKERRP